MTDLAHRVEAVREKIAVAAEKSGRTAEDICLVAVSKTRSVAEIEDAIETGLSHFGENYVQELVEKHESLAKAPENQICWHFIGHLQRNKAKYITPFCRLVHSVDSERLAVEVSRRALQSERRQAVLLQVDLANEQTKFGCAEEELQPLVEKIIDLQGILLQGLMTITPNYSDNEQARPLYQRLARLRDELVAGGVPHENMCHLSMGMSGDYEVAIEEGATIVRVGTAIFGPRH